MASLKDAAELTNEIVELAQQLHAELTEGDVDFEKMVSLADQIGERCDSVAATFSTFNDALTGTLQGSAPGRSENGGGGSNQGPEDSSEESGEDAGQSEEEDEEEQRSQSEVPAVAP